MKTKILAVAVGLSTLMLTGCIGLSFGGGHKTENATQNATLGQQLMDLQRAKEAGAITPAEYEVQKERLLQR